MSAERYDHDAERMVLGAVWFSQGRVLEDSDLTADDFTHAPHRRLWAAFQTMRASGYPFDPAGAHRALGGDVGLCQQALLDVASSGAVPAQFGWHAKTLVALTMHRRVAEAGMRVQQAADGERDPDDLAEFVRGETDRATAIRGAAEVDEWSAVLDRGLSRWSTPVTDAVPTNWHDLDELLSGGGLRPGHLTVIGARPGVGKSLVATMLAGSTAASGRGVYFASVEMSTDQLTDRLAAAATGVNLADLTNRTLDGEQMASLREGVERLRKWPLVLDDRVTTIADLRRGVRNAARRPGGLGLVIVDYLQLLEAPNPTGRTPRHELVAGMSRAIKLMAKEFNVPVVLLSQLNRQSTQREGKQPIISDLRESGAVEQDADEIVLLHRDDDDADLAGQIQLHLAKNRHGATGTVRLRWQPYVSRITNVARYPSAA